MAVFEGEKSSIDIISNGTLSDEVVAFDVPPRYLLHAIPHLHKRSYPSVRLSRVFFIQTMNNVISFVPITTEFDINQEKDSDNLEDTSKCWQNDVQMTSLIVPRWVTTK